MALTDRSIKDAKPRDTVYRLRDGNSNTKGFGITIAPAGSKTFFLGYTSPTTGKRTQINIGRYPGVSLEEAREKAKAYRERLTVGIDPKETNKIQLEPKVEPAVRPSPEAPSETDATGLETGGNSFPDQSSSGMDAIDGLDNRRSVRKYTDAPNTEGRPTYDRGSVERQSYAHSSYTRSDTTHHEINVTDLFRKLWGKKGLIIATVLVCMAATVTILFQITPRYFSETLIMIEPRANKIVDVESVVSGLSGDTESIQSEIQVILSRDLAQRVITALKLDNNPEFNPSLRPKGFMDSLKEYSFGLSDVIPREWLDAAIGEREGRLDKAVKNGPLPGSSFGQNQTPQIPTDETAIKGGTLTINSFLGKMSVKQMGRSRVISVGTTSMDPALAAKIPNTMANLYMDQMIDQKVAATRQASAWLDRRIGLLQDQVAEAEAAVERYRSRSGLLETRGSTVSSLQVAELSTQLIIARTKTAETRARLDQTRQLLNSPEGILTSAEVLKSPFIQKLRETEAEVQSRAAELSNEYGERHPKMISARAEIIDINNKIIEEASKIISGMSNEVEIARARERALSKNLEKLKTEMAKANKAEVKLRSLEREASASRSLLETFLSRYKETSAQEDQDAQRADARIISTAGVPLNPSFPRKKIILVFAFIGSLGLGALLVFLTEILDKGFRGSDQLEELTGIPVFGLIPLLTNKPERESTAGYVVRNPISHFSEAVRTIYTSLLLSHVDNPPTKILMASAQPDEGKTTITLNLARMQAMAGRKVLIIDADLRRPGISKIIGLEDKPGLVELLLEEAEIEDTIFKDRESGAFVIPAGKPTQNPPTLFTSGRMSRIISALDKRFDVIFIDSPPVLAVSDACILATKVDATVLVVRWADTSRKMVMAAVKQLDRASESLAGVVLSMVDLKKNVKYKYDDSFYYQKQFNKYYTYSRS